MTERTPSVLPVVRACPGSRAGSAGPAALTSLCGRPVALAGGPVPARKELLGRTEQARDAVAIGYSMGRDVLVHPNPGSVTRAPTVIARSGANASSALKHLRRECEEERRWDEQYQR